MLAILAMITSVLWVKGQTSKVRGRERPRSRDAERGPVRWPRGPRLSVVGFTFPLLIFHSLISRTIPPFSELTAAPFATTSGTPPPQGCSPVSYTHLTLPTKRIV